MIRVNARLFKVASLFQSTEETRYYLNGVYVEPHGNGALLVATDGRRLMCILDRGGSCDRAAIIALPALMRGALVEYVIEDDEDEDEPAERKRKLGDDLVLVAGDDGHAEIEGRLRALEKCEIDGKFPDWRRVLTSIRPLQPSPLPPALNAEYIFDFAAAAKLLGDDEHARVHCVSHGDEAPALIFFPHCRDAFGIVMPTRSRSGLAVEEMRLPAWAFPADENGGKPANAESTK